MSRPRRITDVTNNTNKAPIKNIHIGRVISVDDPFDANRIKVFIKGIDDKFVNDDSKLPYCPPFLPQFLNIVPKLGETVKVIIYDMNNPYKNREWIGPMISQQVKLKNDPHFFTSRGATDSSISNLEEGISKNPEANGVYPSIKDIAIQGRDNTDIILRERDPNKNNPNSQILIRAGKFVIDNNRKLNKKNPAYIQLNYGSKVKTKIITKTSTKKHITPPTELIHISLTEVSNEFIVKIRATNIGTNALLEEIDNVLLTSKTRQEAIKFIKRELPKFQERNTKWELKHEETLSNGSIQPITELEEEALIFPGNITFTNVEEQIEIPVDEGRTARSIANETISDLNIVADNINILSHKGTPNFQLVGENGVVTPEIQARINEEAEPLIYGNQMLKFLKLVQQFVIGHVHPYNGLPPDIFAGKYQEIVNFPLETLISKNVKIN